MRRLFSLLITLSLAACADDAAPAADLGVDLAVADLAVDTTVDMPLPDHGPRCSEAGIDAAPGGAAVTGTVLNFFGSPWRLSGAGVIHMESPCRRTVSGDKGLYTLSGVPVGTEMTLALVLDGFPPQHTGTITVPAAGVQKFTFQSVNLLAYKSLAALAGIKTDKKFCQIATTVTAYGKDVFTPGAHGEAGTTVTISPTLPAAHGPIYFNASVLPEASLKATSQDGGVIFVNVPPGRYTITAHKAGVKFRPITIKCSAGWLANAPPPWGIQVLK